ncbi:LOW QUALITY PROTEIN: uncharacterized protein LOC126776158 [Nymphalis io]|uniref:LOW QUALITY PROTEIN: uncharacterized protein LOC126776158 n=1 Tax=Inachis io TaxID=171585 RepID=UPI0021698FE6|nr:LOW QUALITY PROTEIN: uncharacterized protein LOC126776158 [Nymphalis io]
MFFLVLSFISCLGLSAAQILQNEQCDPQIQLAPNFDVNQFLGNWYVVRRAANPIFKADCASLNITQNNNALDVHNRVVNENFLEELRGNASVQDGTAKLLLQLIPNVTFDFWILRTDYQNFALAYSCVNQGPNQRNVFIWQLGRQTSFPTDMMEGLMNQTLITVVGITTEDLVDVDHSETACTTLSDIPPGQPIIFPGQCNTNMAVVQNFNVSRFTGVWHQVSSYYTTNALGTCNRAEYTLSGDIVNVVNSQVVNQNLETILGTAKLNSTDNSARLMVTLEVTPGVFVDNPLWILATDYESYAVSYTCTNLANNQRRVNSWVLSRSKELTPAAELAVNRVIRSELDLNNRYLIKADHSNSGCFFYPEPAANRPVIFRGQCDDSVRAMPAFDPVRYMGLWHNIESYPSAFQPGTCNNALYTLNGSTVDVFNTQVINQRLDTINGVATLASTDGSAKLIVSFPIAGTELTTSTDYWVLDTDYTSYALVYSCTNINNDEKRVTSWKLSRTKQMSSNGNTTINNIISTIPVLDQRYYNQNDQSSSGCFYFPEPQPGMPVVFPGQCEDNVQVTSSFNLQQFQGTWYEIQAYPKEQQPGHCISHAFTTSSNNGFSLITSSVNDQFLQVTNSNVRLAGTDGSAKMTITIRVNNQDVIIPYWILDTDYTNYALAYSCVNVNQDFRAVYSWKLSRTKQLSPASNAAINTAISRVTVLDEIYYEAVDQSDTACFYLPVLPPGEPVILNGQCDQNIQVVQNFNAAAYLGRWRLIESYASDFQSGTCNDATYTLSTDGSVLVYNTQVINQALYTINGTAVLAANANTGKLIVTFPDAAGPSEYWILDTDYTSYSLVYSCQNINNQQRRVWSWKLSRTRELTPTAIQNMNRVINTIEVLNNRYYTAISHTDNDCFYYPIAGPNTPVIFRGQCDPNINAVTNFDAVRYMNLWHDIASYPTRFQEGTCNNAFYTLTDGTVDVFNTQVINERLDTMRGSARLATTDGSAKLIVSFPIAGSNLQTETPYWVLTTDYISYALVYSCVNLNEEYRQVWSWKLSRSKTLSPSAETAINNVINTVPVLDNRYYNMKDQSRQGCFYYPEPQPGVPVVFPGQCDANIQAIPNFNMTAFQGTWFEVEAYPKDQQTGQCVNHRYSLGSNNILDLVSSSINNQILGITNSRVTFSSAQDSSGRLTITLTSGGSVITIPFWILSTDYTSYALAYSCVNLNNDFTGVYSWKLSRTKQLTAAANTAINTVIANVVVLDNRYYERTDQSDEACFYLPDAVPNQPVEFVGQCDENITVVQNFNPSRYQGRWRMIESYPEPSQVGSCNDATYSLNADGTTVDVYNTQVRNQELDTINGRAILASNDGSAKLLVYFPSTPEPAPYWVLDTDYDSYALVYSCRNLDNNRRRVTSWKLSRTSELTANAVERINQVVNRIDVLNSRYYARIDQSDAACFYYPTPGLTTPVIFRGQCDQNIPVVTNFDAAAYAGLWHDTSSYPTRFQEGTCNNAFYTLVNGAVDVFNTQVVNQNLETMKGVARLATTDGTAKLIVSFPIAGTDQFTETPYWVLATDYQSYSLVYSCVNINAEQRQVWSWKLSRTKALTSNAATAINNIINTIPVLDNRYYNMKDQSREGCFYYPEPQPGLPVVFPGQCDANIQAVTNFNMQAFQGTWYEIEAYPKDQQTGQCVNHRYSLGSNNILDLVSSSVDNQILGITNSRVTFSSAQDSSGRLTITLTSGGSVITIPFWILSTDYTSYALAYSCVNLNNDFTGVYSWKLSRTKQLTTAANTAINNAIANIVVLNNRYYEHIDQSNEACFYLPDAVPNQPVEFVGQCDETLPTVQNFNPSRYLGKWRLIESYPEPSQVGSCNDATYSLNADGTTVDVYNTQVRNQQLDTINGRAVIASNDGSAKLLVYFPSTTVPAPYWVLDTDYESYALVYSCRNLDNNRRRVTSWKLSRTSELTANAVERINQVVNRTDVLNSRYYARVDQSDAACFYYPPPGLTTPIFRGQCDQNIPVVNNFNATAYLGLWHNIQSYPTQFQEGTCNNALYSLGDGGVIDVFNTQVVKQSLDTMTGSARFATTPETGKLIVSFPVAGTNQKTETPYWVLATDYQSYSLVYTCVNIDSEYRRVFSWKLSRTKQLTTNAATAINAVINTIPVLDDRYYNNNDQSDQGCFYYPEPQPGKPVIFPGQCDQNIQAVPNFNMAAFQGTWHEISAYPKEQQTGQCINHVYSLDSSNSLNLVSSNVINQIFGVTNSRVTFSSAQDTSGRLTITLTSGGSSIVIPFWILNTDYTDYALAYSCVNVDSNSRAVYSWKLSRSKTLSAAGNTAINNRIAQIDVLGEQYYENIDQSDRACFFLPEVNPGQPVVFVGQCDPNIPVVQNFRPDAYAGRWRMIDTYTSDFQSLQGSCIDATYTLTPSGTVDVYNTQVINQALDTITGNATLATTDGSAKLLVNFPTTTQSSDYWILDTDYTSFALVYSCRNINPQQRRVWSWKLSRTRELSAAATQRINQVISTIDVLDERYYNRIDHSDNGCFYYPTPGASPVVFRGQCDESIPVVTNFNAASYMGMWYDIESYPVRFQDGTCPTAAYTLISTGVEVFNTQVVSQQLDTIEGFAVPATTDGSAKLNVSFPIAGTDLTTSSPYWVLATDYTNYAFVYSCANIDDEYRRVGSWKLSRTKSLSPASNTAINNVINTIPVLRQEYYVTRGHTEENCFYYPDNNGGPVIQDGQCDFNSLNVVTAFSTDAFSGPWYEISRFPSEMQEGECVTNEFNTTNQEFRMTQRIVYNERETTYTGSATLASDGRGVLTVNLTNEEGDTFETTLYVLDVNYTDYALLYGCRNINNTNKQVYSWKLSRSQSGLSANAASRINQIVSNTGDLFENYYDETDQTLTGCFHYPVFTEPPAVIDLLGPCDQTIRAKANFNVQAYLGKWYEISSYPQPFQSGECARARYSAGTGATVNVINTQVIDRTLDVQTATAVVASTDGSGLLDVTFVLDNGVTYVANYYVLETDYTSFALVYSCRNLPTGRRQVTSWKLSRNTTLPSQAEPIINNIIENTQGLKNEYYLATNQSEEACFYIPDVNKNEAPLFRGQCGDIQGVQNFDVQRYLGWWHEVESYPTDNDGGFCVSSRFEQIGNEYQITDTNVFDINAQVNTSRVTVDSNGRITKTYSNGEVIDMWVLATDYETYSLLYSCENVDSQYRRVWSAKHSKTRTLSQDAQNAMNSVIQATETLESQFYQPVNQSDAACFHYPAQSGNQVILPGQCDLEIPVLQDFKPAEYSGTWYQIERYPQPYEKGSCVGARYTLDENTGVVTVLNWQVVDGVLDTIEGTATVNSTDGSAKLIVNLPSRDEDVEEPPMKSMELYVLTTDYISYSLAYSCINVGPYQRAVGVWKLSRTRTMTADGDAQINAHMATREELHQPYFVRVEQQDDCAEPSSANLFKSSIIIMLICSIIQRLL